ncbi:MAG: AEC family transporter [Actinomycetota bacterium]|nr:AEC family transporter [Actinomycetota bacterium]
MLALALAIAAAIAAGAGAERRLGERAEALTRRLLDAILYAALPFIAFFVLARADFAAAAGIGLALAYVAHAVAGLAAWLISVRVLHLSPRATATVIVTTIMANTGFLGAPLVNTLLGHDELGPAITYDVLVSGPMFFFVAFAVAAAFTTRGEPAAARMRTFITRNPPLIAVVAGLIAPDSLAPDVLVDIARAGIIGLAPVGFFIVGVQLAAEARGTTLRLSPPVAVVIALRMVVAPLLLIGLAALTVDLPDAYLVQAAMPVAINTLVVAHAYDLDRAIAASALAWSTAIAVAGGLAVAVV